MTYKFAVANMARGGGKNGLEAALRRTANPAV